MTNFIRRYAHVNHVEVCECPRIRCECMRISPRICGSSRECARISVNLFANVRVSPANLRGPSANVRECARMCANPRMCANAARMCAKVRECVRMRLCTSANVSRMCANAPANVCECSRICRECLRKHAVSADGTGHVSRALTPPQRSGDVCFNTSRGDVSRMPC